MKHYPIIVAGEKAAACAEIGWNSVVISLKFSHRKGQEVRLVHSKSDLISDIWVNNFPTYTAIRFQTKMHFFDGALQAIKYCANMVSEVSRSINFDAPEDFITKELLTILG